MGNNHSHDGVLKHGMPRSNSNVDLEEKNFSKLLPTDKLAKLLAEKSLEEHSVSNGISIYTFKKYTMNNYPEFAHKFFMFLASNVEGIHNKEVISVAGYSQQSERILSIVSDKQVTQTYVSMFSTNGEITPVQMNDFLMTVNKIAMDHYPEGPQRCPFLFRTLQAVVESAFHKKTQLSVGYISNWLDEHCPRLVLILHRYVVHILSTAYRTVHDDLPNEKPPGIELTTPVLEKSCFGFESNQPLLPVSQVWLLATSLPLLYTKPSHPTSPVSGTNKPMTSQLLLSKLLDFSCPSHWTLLYNSNQHGLGANRFVFHVSNYRGPTLIFLRGDQGIELCLAAPEEWKESHQYWGSEDCIIVQILPRYQILLRGPKSMYMNLSIRGYPLGIRGGSDPRKPVIEVNPAFNSLKFHGIPYQLESVEVWGCGTPQSREAQLEIKKWEGKEIEKARKVKLSANDWSDHPDRYLLELAGRPSYTTSS